MRIEIETDAWANSQIESKLWLCRTLEETVLPLEEPPIIWILGGWQGVLAHLLLARERMPVQTIRSFDVDPECEKIADFLNNRWVLQDWCFKAFTDDCELLDYLGFDYGPLPDIIINTATEHMSGNAWFDHIPMGVFVIIQSTDMIAPDHHYGVADVRELADRFPLSETYFTGEKTFTYPERTFHRFMLMGIR